MSVGMGQVFELAQKFINMPPAKIEKLLENPIHEVRAGGYRRLCLATLYATVGKGLRPFRAFLQFSSRTLHHQNGTSI